MDTLQGSFNVAFANEVSARGILMVLKDMHCKDMDSESRKKYENELSGGMEAYEDWMKSRLENSDAK